MYSSGINSNRIPEATIHSKNVITTTTGSRKRKKHSIKVTAERIQTSLRRNPFDSAVAALNYKLQAAAKHQPSHIYSRRIRVNVSGKVFEMLLNSTFRYPDTLLGCAEQLNKHFDKARDEYFFDRNREAFEGIAYFYQSCGKFEIPTFVPVDIFYDELKFYGLHRYLNSESKCDDALLLVALEDELKQLKASIEHNSECKEALKRKRVSLKEKFVRLDYYYSDDDEDEANMPTNKIQKRIWFLFERPNSSLLARFIAFVSLITVILSVITMCMETVVDKPVFFNKYRDNQSNLANAMSVESSSSQEGALKTKDRDESIPFSLTSRRTEFFMLEIFCNSVFTIEIFLRIVAAPKRLVFFRDFTNILDIVAVVPFWATLFLNNFSVFFSKLLGTMTTANMPSKTQNNQYGLSVLRILRLTRVLRVLKLSRHVRVLNIMGKILYECVYEIILLLTFLGINIIIFSSMMYYIELYALGEHSPFISIPHSFWWAVISFTTIGYGDLIPQSGIGKFCGSFFILCGILIALLPVPILSCKFERIYKEFSQENKKQEKK